jgi:hexosaminidase
MFLMLYSLIILSTVYCDALASRNAQIDVTAQLFPVPQSIAVSDPTATRSLSTSFQLKTTSTNDVVVDALTRYQKLIQTSSQPASSSTIDTLIVTVKDDTPTMPTLDLDVSYTLHIDTDKNQATVTAHTPFGALYGIETFSQMVNQEGVVLGNGIVIQDAPSFRHRGLTIDVGRRIAPVDLVNSIIDGLGYTKMNVLHMSLSGPAVRVEMLETFPELTAWLEPEQYYTKIQIQQFVERARLRGVIIVPEIDIPAHASGFFPLTETVALQFCDADRTVRCCCCSCCCFCYCCYLIDGAATAVAVAVAVVALCFLFCVSF